MPRRLPTLPLCVALAAVLTREAAANPSAGSAYRNAVATPHCGA